MNPDKYTTKVREAMECARNVAQHHGQQQSDTEHVLYALVKDSQGLVPNLFSKIGVQLRRSWRRRSTASRGSPARLNPTSTTFRRSFPTPS